MLGLNRHGGIHGHREKVVILLNDVSCEDDQMWTLNDEIYGHLDKVLIFLHGVRCGHDQIMGLIRYTRKYRFRSNKV